MKVRQLRQEYSALLAGVSIPARYVYLALQPLADDEGRVLLAPRRLWGRIFPSGDLGTEAELVGWLAELAEARLVEIYGSADLRYLQIADFKKYQRPNRTAPSRLPSPAEVAKQEPSVEPLEDGRS